MIVDARVVVFCCEFRNGSTSVSAYNYSNRADQVATKGHGLRALVIEAPGCSWPLNQNVPKEISLPMVVSVDATVDLCPRSVGHAVALVGYRHETRTDCPAMTSVVVLMSLTTRSGNGGKRDRRQVARLGHCQLHSIHIAD